MELESIAVGTVPAGQADDLREALVGLSGQEPVGVSIQETVMRCTAPDRPDLHIMHTTAAAGGPPGAAAEDRCAALPVLGAGACHTCLVSPRPAPPRGSWVAFHVGLPLKGRGHTDLPATVRSVTRAACAGADVPAAWRALGFLPRYQLAKLGQAFAVPLAGHDIHVSGARGEGPGGQRCAAFFRTLLLTAAWVGAKINPRPPAAAGAGEPGV